MFQTLPKPQPDLHQPCPLLLSEVVVSLPCAFVPQIDQLSAPERDAMLEWEGEDVTKETSASNCANVGVAIQCLFDATFETAGDGWAKIAEG